MRAIKSFSSHATALFQPASWIWWYYIYPLYCKILKSKNCWFCKTLPLEEVWRAFYWADARLFLLFCRILSEWQSACLTFHSNIKWNSQTKLSTYFFFHHFLFFFSFSFLKYHYIFSALFSGIHLKASISARAQRNSAEKPSKKRVIIIHY